MDNNQYKIIENALKQFDEVEYIYISNLYKDNKKIINCNIVCAIDNIIENDKLLKGIIANIEIIKSLFERANINFNYSIKCLDTFKDEMEDIDSDTYQEYYISNIIYTKNHEVKKYC